MVFTKYPDHLLLPNGKMPSAVRPARGIVDPGVGFAVLRYYFGKNNILNYKDLVTDIYAALKDNRNHWISTYTKKLHGLSYAPFRNVYVTVITSETGDFKEAYVFLNCTRMIFDGETSIRCAQRVDERVLQNLNNDQKTDKAVSLSFATRVGKTDDNFTMGRDFKLEIDGNHMRTFSSQSTWADAYNRAKTVLFLDCLCYMRDICGGNCWFGDNMTDNFFQSVNFKTSPEAVGRTARVGTFRPGAKKDNYNYEIGLTRGSNSERQKGEKSIQDNFAQDNDEEAMKTFTIPYYRIMEGARYKNSFFMGDKQVNKYSDTSFVPTEATFTSDTSFIEAGKDDRNPPRADRVPPIQNKIFVNTAKYNAKNALTFMVDLDAPGPESSYCFLPAGYNCNNPSDVKVCSLAVSRESEASACFDYYQNKLSDAQKDTMIQNLCLGNEGLAECDCENRYSNPAYQIAKSVGIAAPDACWYGACKGSSISGGIWVSPSVQLKTHRDPLTNEIVRDSCGTICVNVVNFQNITNTVIQGEIKQNITGCGVDEIKFGSNNTTGAQTPKPDANAPTEIVINVGSSAPQASNDYSIYYLISATLILLMIIAIVYLAIVYKKMMAANAYNYP